MAIYSQLSLAKNRYNGYLESEWLLFVLQYGKKLFYYLSCWKCEALFSRTFCHILLFMVCIFKDVIVIRNYNDYKRNVNWILAFFHSLFRVNVLKVMKLRNS